MIHSRFYSTIAIVISLLLFTDCSKSNDPAPPSLIGTWKLTSGAAINCVNTAQNSPETPCTSNCITITFTATTYLRSDGNGTPNPYTTSGTTINLGYAGSSATDPYTYSLTATLLTLTSASIGGGGCQSVNKYTRQ